MYLAKNFHSYLQFRVSNSAHMHVFGLWEEAGEHVENPAEKIKGTWRTQQRRWRQHDKNPSETAEHGENLADIGKTCKLHTGKAPGDPGMEPLTFLLTTAPPCHPVLLMQRHEHCVTVHMVTSHRGC